MRAFIHAIVILGAALLVGCSSGSKKPDPIALTEPPDDFALGVTVYRPGLPESQVDALPRSLRPARYVVEPGGILRASVGTGSDQETYPPITRQLSPAEVDQLWRAVQGTGLLEEGSTAEIGGPHEYEPLRGRSTAMLYIAYVKQSNYYAVPLDAGDEYGIASRELVERLARLSWIRETAWGG